MSEPVSELPQEERATGEGRSLRQGLMLVAGFLFLLLAAGLLLFGDDLVDRLRASTQPVSALEGVEPIELSSSATSLAPATSQAAPEVGDEALPFMLQDLQGNEVRLADYAGQHVILNFWATWCGPCIFEMPELQAAYEEKADDGVVVLGLNFDEDPQTVQTFLENELDTTVTFPILLDPHAETAGRYAVYNLPTTVFINPEGDISAIHRGPLTQAQIDDYLASDDTT